VIDFLVLVGISLGCNNDLGHIAFDGIRFRV